MKLNRKNLQRLKQPTPRELTDACLDFLRRKFYTEPGDDRKFAQDRRLLLTWVVLWPASWLDKRGVTINGNAYRELFFKTFMEAAAHQTGPIKFRPAYLAQVIQSHWKIHGEDYYEEAKSVRNLAEHALLIAGQNVQAPPDPIRDLAGARDILKRSLPKKPLKAPLNDQLSLL